MNKNFYQAVVCKKIGSLNNLELHSLKSKRLHTGEVRINVKACGMNFPDKLMVEGKYQFKPELPFTPGLEVSGVISETFDENINFTVGTKIMSQLRFGGYAEEIIVKGGANIKILETKASSISINLFKNLSTSIEISLSLIPVLSNPSSFAISSLTLKLDSAPGYLSIQS